MAGFVEVDSLALDSLAIRPVRPPGWMEGLLVLASLVVVLVLFYKRSS